MKMNNNRIVVVFHWHKKEIVLDLDIPVDITANDLLIGLNHGLGLGLNISDLSKCHLKTENPIAFLYGNKTIEEYGLRDGSIINYTI
jgi:uncharacterized ubiquitin-like protein YukD